MPQTMIDVTRCLLDLDAQMQKTCASLENLQNYDILPLLDTIKSPSTTTSNTVSTQIHGVRITYASTTNRNIKIINAQPLTEHNYVSDSDDPTSGD